MDFWTNGLLAIKLCLLVYIKLCLFVGYIYIYDMTYLHMFVIRIDAKA